MTTKAQLAAEQFNMQLAAATALAAHDGVPDEEIIRVMTLIAQAKSISLRGPVAVAMLRKWGRNFELIADRIEATPPSSPTSEGTPHAEKGADEACEAEALRSPNPAAPIALADRGARVGEAGTIAEKAK